MTYDICNGGRMNESSRCLLRNLSTNKTRLLIMTAGILLEELPNKGVTPTVTCGIDSCRALQVKWNVRTRCSQSIADQRRGRTGRTCAGRVFRFFYSNFFLEELAECEIPQMTMSACHNEALAVACADPRAVKLWTMPLIIY
jgi:HrpA-like RNA helicase